jgi:MerR family transcriptional regulator, light-induced transcriptional regulator
MGDEQAFAAELLERSAAAYAAEATARMFGTAAQPHAGEDETSWRRHLAQRVCELAAAVALGEPALFVERACWSRKAFRARGRDEGALRASLEALREVLARQLPPAAGASATDYLGLAIAALEAPEQEDATQGLDPARAEDRLALNFLNLALEGNVGEAVACLVEASAQMSLEALYLRVLMPAQREIGSLWQLGDLSIPEEHLVTTTTQRAMAVLAHLADRQPPNGRTVVVAAVAGNVHDLGLRAATDLFELAGWRALLLGGDVPAEDLPASLAWFEADLLVLSAVLGTQLREVAATVAAVRRRCEREIPILVGGAAFDEAPEAWRKLGADGYAPTLAEATALGARLVGLSAR